MKNSNLRQIIRESIQNYIREIDEAGNVAALEAKMEKTKEAIEKRKSLMNMDGLEEAHRKMIDKNKVKELEESYESYKLYTNIISRDGIPYDLISHALPLIEKEINEILHQIYL